MVEKALIIVPARNEANTLGHILAGIYDTLRHAPADIWTEVLVVDDGSDDETASIAASLDCELIRHPCNLGYGAALRTGFRFACASPYDYALTIDADGQHRPVEIEAFLRHRARDTVVSGSRYLPTSIWFDQPPAPLVNQLFTKLSNLIWTLQITDVGCGMKCINVDLLRRMRFQENGYLFPLDFWRECYITSAVITELPVPMIYCDPTRSVLSKCGSLEIGLDRALHFLIALMTRHEIAYSPQWGQTVARDNLCSPEHLRTLRLIEREMQSVRWQTLPLCLALANISSLRNEIVDGTF